jgi:hypothetical protein
MKKSRHILLSILFAAGAALPAAAQEEAPYIIFISENNPAKTAIETLVISEYNAEVIEDLRVNDFSTWETETSKPSSERFVNYTAASFRDVPFAYRSARYSEIQSALNLQDDDPADKGFTDLLEAAGYTVYRSQTTVTEDPITGAITRDNEFWGDVGEPFSEDGDYRLSQDQIDFLSQADLIIVSMDVTPNRYAAGGREGGVASTVLIEQWNGLQVPIIAMHNELIGTMEFGSWGWGWSYGFTRRFNTIQAYDREAIQGSDRFVFPDYRPAVTTNDPVFLDGVSTVDDNRLPIYMDYSMYPILPRIQVKFSNNKNYNYPGSANVVLEILAPSFVNSEVGDIPIHTPVMIEFPANIPAFVPQDGVPVQERVAVPAAPRLYFAAGMTDFGLYNLSPTGETVFLNAVEKYAGPGSGGGNTWYGYEIDGNGWVDTASWLDGFVQVDNDPWVYPLSLQSYIYVPDDSGWIYIPK